MKNQEADIYTYGETPLTTIEFIAKESRLSSKDRVFELGCGRGRTCFWLSSFIGCQVVGIEYIPEFVERANKIKSRLGVDQVQFRNENMLESSFDEATVIYLYGTCYDEFFIKKLIEKFKDLPQGTRIITVSYPLTDYCESSFFEVMNCFSAKFTWGKAEIFLQIKK